MGYGGEAYKWFVQNDLPISRFPPNIADAKGPCSIMKVLLSSFGVRDFLQKTCTQ